MKKSIKKAQDIISEQEHIESLKASLNRARAVTVGTAFGGTTEVSMRRVDGTVMYAILQPVETIELINQLAANIGCHIIVQPRNDFATWRDWRHSEEELEHYRGIQPIPGTGHAPHNKPLPKNAPAPDYNLIYKGKSNETMAIEKPKNKRNTKRTTAAT